MLLHFRNMIIELQEETKRMMRRKSLNIHYRAVYTVYLSRYKHFYRSVKAPCVSKEEEKQEYKPPYSPSVILLSHEIKFS